jgi:hypothetical protein
MADNVNVTPGSGKTVLADEVTDAALAGGSTGIAQYVKLMDGTVDSSTKVVAAAPGDALAPAGALAALGLTHFYNPATAAWERARTPTTYKYVNVSTPSAGNTTVWTPTTGKKFRLMAALIVVTGNANRAAGGQVQLQLTDGAGGTTIIGTTTYVPTTSGTVMGSDFNSGWMVLPGNGYLSAAANNVLVLNTGAAITTGAVAVTAVGTEE